MSGMDKDIERGGGEAVGKGEEYAQLRSEGILPADIGAYWRLKQAGEDLREALVERFSFEHETVPEAVRPHLEPTVVLNLGRFAHDLAAAGLRFGLAINDINDATAPITPRSPFRRLDGARSVRIERDPARSEQWGDHAEREVQIDVAPLCAYLASRCGVMPAAYSERGVNGSGELARCIVGSLSGDALLEIPCVETGDGKRLSIGAFCAQLREELREEKTEDFIRGCFELMSDPERVAKDAFQLGVQLLRRGDAQLAVGILESIPPSVRAAIMDGREPDFGALSVDEQEQMASITGAVNATRDLVDELEGMQGFDLRDRTEPFRGLALSGKEVAARAREELVTHDIEVQRRVAEHMLYEKIDPASYRELSRDERESLKVEVEGEQCARVERRAEMYRRIQEISGPKVVVTKAHESLERARYELRCFRLSKGKL